MKKRNMLGTYTTKYTKIGLGYTGQLVGRPEVVTEGKTREECSVLLQEALSEMVLAHRQQNRRVPVRV